MKLILDATVLQQPATGVAKSTLGLYKACLQRMPELEITALHRLPLQCSLPKHVKSLKVGANVPITLWRPLILPYEVIRANPDYVHFPWNGNVPKHLSNTKVISTLHDVLPIVIPDYFESNKAEKRYRNRLQADINRSNLIITVSEYSKTQIECNFSSDVELLVVPECTTLQECDDENEQGLNLCGRYFLYVGGYHPRKGIVQLLRVFLELFREKILTYKLALTGERNYFSAEFKQLIKDGLQMGAIEEMGYVSDKELACLYSQALALVYPSKYEGFGLPPLEAMSLGCPVITTRCTSIPEVCGNAAYYIDIDNDDELRDGLINIQNDRNLRNELGKMGRNQAKKFSWDNSAKQFLAALEKLG